jgi:sensor histidine kinase YesM
MNRRYFYWFLQILGWISYGGLIFLASYNKKGFDFTYNFFVNLIITVLLGIYLSDQLRKRIKTKGLLKIERKLDLINTLTIVLITSFVFVLLTKCINLILTWSLFNLEIISFLINWTSYFLLFGFWLTLYYVYHLFEKTQRQELDYLLLKATQSELELQNLKSQLNPHFLFNALNAIRALIEVEPKKAKEAVSLLSNLLRFSLSTSEKVLVPIEKELHLVKSYLKLEKIRFEERLNVELNLSNDVEEYLIPAFMIQTLVENAIKHGISKLVEGGNVSVHLFKENDFVVINVSNSGSLGKNTDIGIGLSNLKKRLEIQYGSNYSFDINETDMVTVEIKLPANR